jgi:sortase (surface protein transpeptidase)
MIRWAYACLAAAGLGAGLIGSACSVGAPTSAADPAREISPAPWQYASRTPRPAAAPPQRIRIPAIGVDAAVEPVALGSDFSMDVPQATEDVGWYSLGASPGQPGDAVVDGHLDAPGGAPAVFWRLQQLHPGDRIQFAMADGRTVIFAVTSGGALDAGQVPAGHFETGGPSRVTLVTCAGSWDRGRQAYTQRFVVEAVPALA